MDPGSVGPPPDWVTASELADYAYCPRSWWYGQTLGPDGRTPEAARLVAAGEVHHQRVLSAESDRERFGSRYYAVVAAAALLILGGVAWLLF